MKLLDVAKEVVNIKGKKMNVRDYQLFKEFYNSNNTKTLIKSGRQVGKSTSLAIKQVIKTCLIPYTHILSILPLAKQSYRFSKLYVDAIFNDSKILQQRLSTSLANTLSLKQLNNGSHIHLSYVGENADRIRGVSVKELYWDEIQDVLSDNIPVAEQCASSYSDAKFYYCGTPKTLNNTIESLWKKSSQNEPYILCSRCNHENFCIIPEVYKMIQKEGLCCQKCLKLLSWEDIYNVTYRCMNPIKKDLFEGYHIPQIFVPFNLVSEKWPKILLDYEDYSEFFFATEVLGISFDLGGTPITLEKLMSCCSDRIMGRSVNENYTHRIMGIDWGYASSRSFTVVTIVGVRPDRYDVIYAKKYKYRDRLDQIKSICNLFKSYGCQAVGCDHGAGFTDNLELRKYLGPDKVWEYNYCAPQKTLKYLKDQMLFATHRNRTLGLLFSDLNKGHISFPRYEDIAPFFEDILAVYEEVRSTPRGDHKYYDHNIDTPDDYIHALNFAMLTTRLLTKETILESIIDD